MSHPDAALRATGVRHIYLIIDLECRLTRYVYAPSPCTFITDMFSGISCSSLRRKGSRRSWPTSVLQGEASRLWLGGGVRILMDREGELQLVFVRHFTPEKSVHTLHKVVLKNLHYILVTQKV